ncbi:hypothetical protein O3P69_020807 [Scylla paramamosain]|uniref:Soluble interferon alpha/beta receptor OPG204 n=1 Tax=Scylla paramamosain TaxID=85552 RepID=A0AAW0TMX9_SCYPA
MGGFLVTQLIVVLALLPGLLLTKKIGKSCPCQRSTIAHPMADDTYYTDMKAVIFCCKDTLLGYQDPGASIQWSFNGEAYSKGWSSSFKADHCSESIMTTSTKISDNGIYSCTITASNGTSETFTMSLSVERNIQHRKPPESIKGSPSTVAQLQDRIALTCESYVGTNDTLKHGVSITWYKYFPNNTIYGFADDLPNVTVTRSIDSSKTSWGTLKEELVISSVHEIHFGRYECRVTNNYGGMSCNISLTEGIPEVQVRILQYKTTVAVVAGLLVVVLVLLLGWCRCGLLISLYCRRKTSSSEDNQYDVFLVHGESTSRWVWSFLLPALEDSFGYKCFLPQRDMCGGDMVAESILEAMEKCRRVVVVMTPCLLDSPWATWATYSGIQTALTSRARILALVHKEQSLKSNSLHPNPFLSVLKVVKKIKLPEEFARDFSEQRPLQPSDIPMQERNNQKTELKLIIPEIDVRNSSSNSLSKSQRFSNMISGSNAASREDLECTKNKPTQVGHTVVFMFEDQGPQDPGSPNSVTPFILSPHPKPHRCSDSSVWQSVSWCFQMICIGDPEEQFWQKLRLHFGPPLHQQAQVH